MLPLSDLPSLDQADLHVLLSSPPYSITGRLLRIIMSRLYSAADRAHSFDIVSTDLERLASHPYPPINREALRAKLFARADNLLRALETAESARDVPDLAERGLSVHWDTESATVLLADKARSSAWAISPPPRPSTRAIFPHSFDAFAFRQ